MKTLELLYARRVQFIKQARDQLREALGEAAWRRLEGFLDGEFRTRIRKRTLQ